MTTPRRIGRTRAWADDGVRQSYQPQTHERHDTTFEIVEAGALSPFSLKRRILVHPSGTLSRLMNIP